MVAPERAGDGLRPHEGWQLVTLPDLSQRHWPGFSGPAWYRLDWRADCQDEPMALNIDRMVMSAEVWPRSFMTAGRSTPERSISVA